MITFLINFDKDIDKIELTKLYFYPYLKNQKIKIINCSNKANDDVFNEIKYYLYNSSHLKKSKKEFQLLFVVPIFDNSAKYFSKNLTNRILKIEEDFLNRLSEERLEPEYINFITIDDLERDFKSTPLDVNASIGEELDKKGYISAPTINFDELLEIENKWAELIKDIKTLEFSSNSYEKLTEDEKNDIDNLKEIFYVIDEVIKRKIDIINEDSVGSIDGSAMRQHIKKYDIFKKKLRNDLEHDLKMRVTSIKKLDFKSLMLSILKKENYYYEYLFSEGDILKLNEVWNRFNPSLSGEEQYNLSIEYLNRLKNLKVIVEETIDKIVEQKLIGFSLLGSKDEERIGNIYLNKRTIKQIGERTKERFIKRKIDIILENKSLKDGRLINPSDVFKDLLKENYSIEKTSSQNNYKVFRVPFEKKNTLEFNQNLLKFSSFALFLVEYAEKRESYIFYNKYFHLKDVEYKKNYNNIIFDRFIEILYREKNRIESEKENLKKNIEIDYYAPTDESFNDLRELKNINKVSPPEYGKMAYSNGDINSYLEWIDNIEFSFSDYIEKSNEALFEYQNSKNRFITAPRGKKIIDTTMEQEVNERKNILEELRKDLSQIEENIEVDIKNNWKKECNRNWNLNVLKTLLEKRPSSMDLVKLMLLAFIQIFIYGYYKNTESAIMIGASIIVTFLIIFIIISILITVLSQSIKSFLNNVTGERNSYSNILSKKMDLKKKHIDKEIELRIAEKNYQLAKRKENELNEQQELLEYYKAQIDSHCENAKDLKRVINNIGKRDIDEIDYLNETFNVKLNEINYKKIPFENDKFNPSKYIEISQYKNIKIYIDQQENTIIPQDLFGCHSILLSEDKIYNEVMI